MVGTGATLDPIVMGVFTQNNSRHKDVIRSDFMPVFGLRIVKDLGANLSRDTTQSVVAPTTAIQGSVIQASMGVRNEGGGDAPPFDVDFVLSDDTRYGDFDDVSIGTVRVPGLEGGAVATVNLNGLVPFEADPGTYFIGWEIDPLNEAPEYDESNAENRLIWISLPATEVEVIPFEVFSENFESGTFGGWSGVVP